MTEEYEDEPVVEEAVKLPPITWATRKGHLRAARMDAINKAPRLSTGYKVANALYRWSENDYHYQNDPFLLTEEDFDEAMVASSLYPAVEPHEAAITPFARSLRAKKAKQ